MLVEVQPDAAEELRAVRRFSSTVLPCDILWTDAEEAARAAEEAEALVEAQKQRAVFAERDRERSLIAGRIGLTSDELVKLING